MSKISNDQYTIKSAFKNCFYIIPDYQREYVWTEKEVHQLLQDISDQMEVADGQDYFIGMVLVSPTSEKDCFEVIDGQQRLTTFFLLLCALRKRFEGQIQKAAIETLISESVTTPEGDEVMVLKLDPRYENASEVMEKVVALNDLPEPTKAAIENSGIKSFGSLENLLDAYASIHDFLDTNFHDFDSLKKFWGFLSNQVIFIQISTDVSSALKIFETINERGVGLNPMDLLKNLLFTQVDQKEFTKLKNEWKKITGPLEKSKEKPLRFLRYFLMANYKIKNKDGIVREDDIYDWLTDKDNVKLCGYKEKPFDFVRKIIRNVEKYLSFSAGRGNDDGANIPMDNLTKLCGGAFSQHYVLLLAVANLPKPLFDQFVIQLESFLFYYIFTKTPTKDLERSFSAWADELREISVLSDANAQRKALNEFVEIRFAASMSSKGAELSDAMKRYSLKSMQKYRTKYLLCKLTQHVDMAFTGAKTAGSLDDYYVLEMEHILPNTPEADLRASFASTSPEADYNEYKNRLGNFTLLEKPINIVASNNFFDLKMPEYKKCQNYLTRSIVELTVVGQNSSINRVNEKLETFDEWGAASIDARQAMLAELAKDVWKTSAIEA
tara:strand:- start:855 stop:2684 length:1830 start_codon:yes stop_codon:yes gene_type:complete